MSSLLALQLLSQQTPNLQTRKGLILTGLQHDFLSPDGKLPVADHRFLDQLEKFTAEFRKHGDIIWVRSEFEANRNPSDLDEAGCNVITSSTQDGQTVAGESRDDRSSEPPSLESSKKRKAGTDSSSDADPRQKHRKSEEDARLMAADLSEVDEEFFLSKTPTREPSCVKGSVGADYTDRVKRLMHPNDLQVVKSYYSAFSSTSLLMTLRTKLITELYVGGCMTNMSVYATAMDAARYGIKIALVSDCLGYRKRERHDLAINRLVEIMEAKVTTSEQAVYRLENPSASDKEEDNDDGDDEDDEEDSESEEIAFGKGATKLNVTQLNADDPLEVDSDDEEGEMDLQTVRPSYAPGVAVHLPYRAPERRRLPDVGENPSRKPSAKYPKPARPSPQLSKPNSNPIESPDTRLKDNSKGGSKTGTPASGESGITHDESRARQPGRQPLPEVLRRQPRKDAAHTKHRGLSGLASAFGIDQKTVDEYEAAARTQPRARRPKPENTIIERQRSQPTFGTEKEDDSHGSSIQYDLLPPDRLDGVFARLNEEVKWQRMSHKSGEVPRLVCCQGTVDTDGSMPVYRHPADEIVPLIAWTSTVDEIRKAAEALAGHELNHALIQLYRGGPDFISEHSDKTIDITPDSSIVNVSFGAERVMRLRSKRSGPTTGSSTATPAQRTTHRVRLPHNSALLMSLNTNARYLHGIMADKRAGTELTPEEKAYGGRRISLTFRRISTFLSRDLGLIWGQGAVGKTRDEAGKVLNGPRVESEELLKGFGKENQDSEGRWEEWYGVGSDVLNLR